MSLNEVFQLLMGVRLEQHKQGRRPGARFRLRMPWLLSNITGGLIWRLVASAAFFEETMQKIVLIALFIPLILTVAESVAVQSMTLAIEEAVAGGKRGKSGGRMRREVMTALFAWRV